MNENYILGFPVTSGSYEYILDSIINKAHVKRSAVVCVANVHMFIEARQDPDFLKIVKSADIVTADGLPLIWMLNVIYKVKQERVAGMDLLPDLLYKMSEQNITAYFYGGTQSMLSKTKSFLQKKYPKLKIAGLFSPSFGEQINVVDELVLESINNLTSSIVFVILGCPKQEKWMASMKGKINTVMIGIGGALPVMIGMRKRAPQWMQKYGLEWLFRLSQEPRRLFKRYLETNSIFLWIFLRELIKVKILGFSNQKN
jgi:N-acetylglucosaminyldiphosphoundecaprenol N-acetyl-beta-D-mannosaminyltransferase